MDEAVEILDPDLIVCIGMRHWGVGRRSNFDVFSKARDVIAVGSDIEHIKNIANLSMAVLADERRALTRLHEMALSHSTADDFAERRTLAIEQAAMLQSAQVAEVWQVKSKSNEIRSLIVAETLDKALERRGGGLVMIEQYAVPWDKMGGYILSSEEVKGADGGRNRYLRAAGGCRGEVLNPHGLVPN